VRRQETLVFDGAVDADFIQLTRETPQGQLYEPQEVDDADDAREGSAEEEQGAGADAASSIRSTPGSHHSSRAPSLAGTTRSRMSRISRATSDDKGAGGAKRDGEDGFGRTRSWRSDARTRLAKHTLEDTVFIAESLEEEVGPTAAQALPGGKGISRMPMLMANSVRQHTS